MKTLTITAADVTALNSSRASPKVAGTGITFSPVVTGGTAPYQYKYWLYDGVTNTLLRDWSTTATYTWTPTQANASYLMIVWVRSAGVTADTYEDFGAKAFPITP